MEERSSVELEARKFEVQNKLSSVYDFLRESGITKVRPTGFHLVDKFEDLEEMGPDQLAEQIVKTQSGRSFWLISGAHPDHRLVLTKLYMKAEGAGQVPAMNEALFYRDLRSYIMQHQDPEVLGNITLPSYLCSGRTSQGGVFTQIEFVEGDVVSPEFFEMRGEPMDLDKFSFLVRFIRRMQEVLTPEVVASLSPDIVQDSSGPTPTQARNREKLLEDEEDYREMLGSDLYDSVLQLLDESEDFIASSGNVFTNVDINVANLIESDAGLVTIVDWERLKLVDNRAAAYSYVPNAHWMHPEVQQEMFRQVLDCNADDPDFKELFRLHLIFFRFSRIPMVYYWKKIQQGNLADEQRDHCLMAVARFKELIKEAVYKEGVWSDDYDPTEVKEN